MNQHVLSDPRPGLHAAPSRKRNLRNAAYNLADQLLPAIAFITATPFLVFRLGVEQYGIWMLVNALTGAMGFFSVGLGDATIKYVSGYRGKEDPVAIKRVLHSTLALSLFLTVVAALLVFITSDYLAHSVFRIEREDQQLAVHAIQIGGILLGLRFVESVFLSCLRGFERYDLSAKISMGIRIGTLVFAVSLVAVGYGVVAILLMTCGATLAGIAVQVLAIRRLLPIADFWPSVEPAAIREVLGFGIYSWLQGIGGILFTHADRLLIGALLGPAPLAYYTICTQLAQQIHALPAAALNFLFPMMSSLCETGERKELRRLFLRFVLINLVFAFSLFLPLVLFGRLIMTLWMGADFANQSYVLLLLLSVAYFLLAINIVPHNTLLGVGRIRFVSLMNLGGGFLSLVAAGLLIPHLGVQGAAMGRMFYGPAIAVNYLKVKKTLRD